MSFEIQGCYCEKLNISQYLSSIEEGTTININVDFKTNNSKSYNEEYDNYALGVLSRKDLKKNIWSKVIKHMGNNINKSKEVYESCMVEVNVEVLSV